MTCGHCSEPILEGEPSTKIPRFGARCAQPYHIECAMRLVIGGLNHLLGRCSCCGDTEPPDPPELTRREAARAALAHYASKGSLHQ
jgi:hypothetical protein